MRLVSYFILFICRSNIILETGPVQQRGYRLVSILVRHAREFQLAREQISSPYDVRDVQTRLGHLLTLMVRLKGKFERGAVHFASIDLAEYESLAEYLVHYAVSEYCCYLKSLGSLIIVPCSQP